MELVKQNERLNAETLLSEMKEQNIISHQLPPQVKQDLTKQMNDAIEAAQNINNKTHPQTGTHFYKSIINEQIGLKIYDYNALWDTDLKSVQRYSITTPLRDVIMFQVKKLIQIQFQIDLKTNQLIRMPSGVFVHKFIQSLFSVKTQLLKILELLLQNLTDPNPSSSKKNLQVRKEILGPIMNYIKDILQKQFGYMVDPAVFVELLALPISQPLIYTTQEIIKRQTQNIKFNLKKAEQRACIQHNLDMSNMQKAKQKLALIATLQVQKYMATLLRKRKISKKDENFFQIIRRDRWNFEKNIRDSFDAQIKFIKDFQQKQGIQFTARERLQLNQD